jgi:hypothetical protein
MNCWRRARNDSFRLGFPKLHSAVPALEAIIKVSAEADLLKTLPCVGTILRMVLMLEIGLVDRFPTARTWPATRVWYRVCILVLVADIRPWGKFAET